jgi:hypothetical protein
LARTVEFRESDPPTNKTKRIAATFRDHGCGIAPDYLSRSLFHLGSMHKQKDPWQQGAFGLGGASTFRNARAVIVVSRVHPDLTPEDDWVMVAACEWIQFEKGMGLHYLTTSGWDEGRNPDAEPWSAPASAFPEFEGGTQVTLVSYGIPSYSFAARSETSFEWILNTRLFRPVTPVRFTNHIIGGTTKARKNIRGLKRQFEENPRQDRRERTETLPFMIDGTTYHLPIASYYFEAGARSQDIGSKRSFVAGEHALMFVSNGQAHHHWTPEEMRHKTDLKHIADRLFVVVELDALRSRSAPIAQGCWMSTTRAGWSSR